MITSTYLTEITNVRILHKIIFLPIFINEKIYFFELKNRHFTVKKRKKEMRNYYLGILGRLKDLFQLNIKFVY